WLARISCSVTAISANRSSFWANRFSLSTCMAAMISTVWVSPSRRSSMGRGFLGSALCGMGGGISCSYHRIIASSILLIARIKVFVFPSSRAMRNHRRWLHRHRRGPPEGRRQFSSYQTEGFYDEMFQADGAARPHYQLVQEIIQSLSDGQLLRYKHAAERLLLQLGITFNVYGDTAGTERIFPFDLIPRIVPAHEWERIERGLKQRIHALNAFIGDIYHDQKILKDGAIPAEVVTSAVSYRQQ